MIKKEMELKAVELIKKNGKAFILIAERFEIPKKEGVYSNDLFSLESDGQVIGVFENEKEAENSFKPSIYKQNHNGWLLVFDTARVIEITEDNLKEAEDNDIDLFGTFCLFSDGGDWLGIELIDEYNK